MPRPSRAVREASLRQVEENRRLNLIRRNLRRLLSRARVPEGVASACNGL